MRKNLTLSLLAAIVILSLLILKFTAIEDSFFVDEGPPMVVTCPSADQAPAIWIYRHPGMADFETYLEFAIWPDGTFVFRKDGRLSDSQLLINKTDPSLLLQLVEQLKSAGLYSADIENFHVPSSSGYTSIEIVTDQAEIVLASWHEEFETGDTMEPKADWSKGYTLLRNNWRMVRQLCDHLKENAAASKRVSLTNCRESKN